MCALSQMSTVVIQCPDIASAPCVKDLMHALFSSPIISLHHPMSRYKEGMVLVAHSPLSLIQDNVHETLLAGASSFLHSFNVISCIYYSYHVEQGLLGNE